jgi:uncharacterized repeat protein (TIGR02543 family)
LPIPTKTDYTFAGWYDNAELNGTAVTAIPANSTGNKEFWAKWTPSNSGTKAYLVKLSINGNDIDIPETGTIINLEYIAGCGEQEVTFNEIEASPDAVYKVNGAEYSGQSIALTEVVTMINIQVDAETGSAEQHYSLKVTKAIADNRLYYKRWDDVLAINNNPLNNGGYTVEAIRWYEAGSNTVIETGGYISTQGFPLNYYAEIKVEGEWHHACQTLETTSAITVYPNPVSRGQTVNVKQPADIVGGYLNIFSITGSLVRSKVPLPSTNNSIEVLDLPTGIYLFKITTKSGNHETVKIIIE